jgi:hypothetical protein
MVLLHYHVVPGIGDDNRPRPEPTPLPSDQVVPADCDDVAITAASAVAIATPAGDPARAAA